MQRCCCESFQAFHSILGLNRIPPLLPLVFTEALPRSLPPVARVATVGLKLLQASWASNSPFVRTLVRGESGETFINASQKRFERPVLACGVFDVASNGLGLRFQFAVLKKWKKKRWKKNLLGFELLPLLWSACRFALLTQHLHFHDATCTRACTPRHGWGGGSAAPQGVQPDGVDEGKAAPVGLILYFHFSQILFSAL